MRLFRQLFLCVTSLQCFYTVLSKTVERATQFPDLYEASVVELQDGLERGDFSSVDLVKVNLNFTARQNVTDRHPQ